MNQDNTGYVQMYHLYGDNSGTQGRGKEYTREEINKYFTITEAFDSYARCIKTKKGDASKGEFYHFKEGNMYTVEKRFGGGFIIR